MQRNLEWLAVAICVAALLVPIGRLWSQARAEREQRDCGTNLKNIGVALENYSTDYAGRYPRVGPSGSSDEKVDLALLTPRYLATAPTCPAGDAYELTTGV